MTTAPGLPVDPILVASLRGDAGLLRQLVAAELEADAGHGPGPITSRRTRLVADRAFAAILDSDFAGAYDDCELLGRPGAADDLLVRVVKALASAMGGLERDGPDSAGVERVVGWVSDLADAALGRALWTGCLGAEAAMSVGRLDLAETVSRRVWSVGDARLQPEVVFAGMTLTRALLFQGRLGEAADLGVEVVAVAAGHDLLALQLVVCGTLAYVAALRDDDTGLRSRVAEVERLAPACSPSYLVSGATVMASYALAATGHARQAYELFLRAAGGPDLSRVQLVDRAYGYELLVTAALSLGELEQARRWGALSVALVGTPIGGMAHAAVRRTAARLAVAEGDSITSAALAGQASSDAVRHAGHLDAARAQLLEGSALLHSRGNEELAHAVLSSVGTRATALGATTLSLLARRDLRSIGLRPTGVRQAPMSRRERQVADLLVAGLSNHDIARTLNVSDRTVHCHVRRVLEALELPSRASIPRAFGRGVASATTYGSADGPTDVHLTSRQREVSDLVSRGYTNAGIARDLGVSVKTVEKHLGDIYRRLGVTSRAGLAARRPGDGGRLTALPGTVPPEPATDQP